MKMDMDLQKAIMESIRTEKNAMEFYRLGAARMDDTAAKRLFEQLASEERAHAGQFYKYYQGSDIPSLEVFLDTHSENSALIMSLERIPTADFTEKNALELAMVMEKDLKSKLLETAGSITAPEVRSVYELNAHETHNHYLTIEAEYARLMGMVAESDMDTFVRE
jgi:rubrerythrin